MRVILQDSSLEHAQGIAVMCIKNKCEVGLNERSRGHILFAEGRAAII
jgi:hypothetical protein